MRSLSRREDADVRVAEEEATDHVARSRDDRHGEIAPHRQMARWHAVVRSHPAVARVREDVVAANGRVAPEGGTEERGRARVPEMLERLARRAGERVEHVGVAVGVDGVVEKRAEARTAERRRVASVTVCSSVRTSRLDDSVTPVSLTISRMRVSSRRASSA